MNNTVALLAALTVITLSNTFLSPKINRYDTYSARQYIARILSPIVAMGILLLGKE